MLNKETQTSFGGSIILLLVVVSVLFLKTGFIYNNNWYWGLLFTLPLLLIAIVAVKQTKHSILRNYPIIGRMWYLLKFIRPKIRQYILEDELDGKPSSRRKHSIKNKRRTRNYKKTEPNLF